VSLITTTAEDRNC